MAGKGDKRRKCQVPQSVADDNYDAIFNKKKRKPKEVKNVRK